MLRGDAVHRVARRALLAGWLLAQGGGCGGAAIGSVGAVLSRHKESHALTVRDTPSGLAADRAGLEPNDEIIMIEGHYVRDLTMNEVTSRLRGEVGSWVELTILRIKAADDDREPHVDVRRIRVQRTAITPREKPTSGAGADESRPASGAAEE